MGSLDLGDALADRRVSPVDLFEGADMDDDRVLNVARLLQSLDADGNPGARRDQHHRTGDRLPGDRAGRPSSDPAAGCTSLLMTAPSAP